LGIYWDFVWRGCWCYRKRSYRDEMNREADPPNFYNKFDNIFKAMASWAGKTGTIDESKLTKFLVDESKLVSLSESNYVD